MNMALLYDIRKTSEKVKLCEKKKNTDKRTNISKCQWVYKHGAIVVEEGRLTPVTSYKYYPIQ